MSTSTPTMDPAIDRMIARARPARESTASPAELNERGNRTSIAAGLHVATKIHGTPISPKPVLEQLAGYSFCVSYAAPRNVERVHEIGASVMLDNGAFSIWRRGIAADWPGFYRWAEPWLDKYPTTWAVIPDVIDGNEEDNDALIAEWPHGDRGAPVWHLHEPIDRLRRLCAEWDRVCIGSSGEYAQTATKKWHRRMEETMNRVCGNGPPPAKLHMLRGLRFSEGPYPFDSMDSTDIARNHNRGGKSLGDRVARALSMAERWEAKNPPKEWRVRGQMELTEVPS